MLDLGCMPTGARFIHGPDLYCKPMLRGFYKRFRQHARKNNRRTIDQNIRLYKSLLDCKVWKGKAVLPSCCTRFALSHNCCGFN